MTRTQLEHIIRAAATIADDDELVIVGSQAILGEHPDAPAEVLVSIEADLFPKIGAWRRTIWQWPSSLRAGRRMSCSSLRWCGTGFCPRRSSPRGSTRPTWSQACARSSKDACDASFARSEPFLA